VPYSVEVLQPTMSSLLKVGGRGRKALARELAEEVAEGARMVKERVVLLEKAQVEEAGVLQVGEEIPTVLWHEVGRKAR